MEPNGSGRRATVLCGGAIAASLLQLIALSIVTAKNPQTPELPPMRVHRSFDGVPLATAAAAIVQGSGLQIEVDPAVAETTCSATFDQLPLWQALEQLAATQRLRLLPAVDGRRIRLLPRGQGQPISTTSGPFRIAVQSVTARLLPEEGTHVYDLELLVHWEPRYPVYRIDAAPRWRRIVDDQGQQPTAEQPQVRQYPSAAAATLTSRLRGLRRAATTLAELDGECTATAAERLLSPTFTELFVSQPVTKSEAGITLRWHGLRRNDTLRRWEATVEMTYPPDHPQFDSFEESKWLRDVHAQLVSPQGVTTKSDQDEVYASGRQVQAVFRWTDDVSPQAKGWSVVCVIPSPLREYRIPFRLRNVPLP